MSISYTTSLIYLQNTETTMTPKHTWNHQVRKRLWWSPKQTMQQRLILYYNTYIALEKRLPIIKNITRSQVYDTFVRATDALLFQTEHHFITHHRLLVKYIENGKLAILCPECYQLENTKGSFIQPGSQMKIAEHFLLPATLIHSIIEISTI